MLDIWGGEENDTNDNLSFEDSDRFEEDSLCSWSSEPESVCNNWRGWKKPSLSATTVFGPSKKSSDDVERVSPLCELAARCVASHIPFELVEHVYPPVPEQLQLRIAYWSFPDNEEDIRLYSCLANSSADEFQRGEHLYRSQAIKDPLQIGFHLSASVCAGLSTYNVAVTFDRRRITSCNCTCNSTAYWCSHIVAVCLHRIHEPTQVCLRAPVSESLSRLQRDQLQKFAQYLISELPQQILPTAQRLLDELLSSQPSAINSVCGAPDPTAGASANEQTSWYLDEKTLHDNIKKILIKFCVPAPIVFSDVNYLSNTAPPAAAEWTSLLRPLRGREPEGMWNLLSIVREMFKRNDRNALPLLEIITEECMACEQILVWWFYTKVALHAGYSGGGGGKHSSVNSNSQASQHACSSLCDEIVVLWRLAALNPATSPAQRNLLRNQFKDWHLKVIEKVTKRESLGVRQSGHSHNKLNPLEVFSGFKPAVEACFLDWDDYPLPGITYTSQSWLYQNQLFPCFRHNEPPRTGNEHPNINPVNSTQVVLDHHQRSHHHYHYHNPHLHHTTGGNKRLARNTSGTNRQDRHNQLYRLNLLSFMSHSQRQQQLVVGGNHSSVSSEGFCDGDIAPRPEHEETDSQGGGGSDSSWSSGREGEGEPEGEPVTPAKFMGYSGDDSDSSPPAHHPLPHPSPPRRLSKDDSLSSSNSDWQPSGDEFNVYYYDPKALENGGAGASGSGAGASGSGANAVANNVNGEVNGQPAPDDNQQPEPLPSDPKEAPAVTAQTVLQNIHGLEDPWEILFARAEGLHAHGHVREACTLGVRLAEEMLANPPDLMIEFPPILAKGKRKKQVNPASHQLSVIASNTLAKCGFLCQVLAENADYFNLAFKVGLFGLELARPPASTKPLEVKLANQESELVTLLKRIPLGEQELVMIRGRAHHLREGTLKSRGRALLPINLAGYILDALINTSVNRECRCQLINPNLRMPGDEMLGFEAAVAALGVKANVSEADHPLLCEGTRRQRGDLAITLLVLYKDDPHKLARIMDKLLDREVHQLIKSPVPYSFYSSNPPVRGQFLLSNRGGLMPRKELDLLPPPQQHPHAHQHHQYPHPHPHTHPHPYPQDGMIDASNMNGANSRPHSCTSAEFEQGLANLSLSSPGTSHVTPPITPSAQRLKETTSRFKGKRAYPSIPNQPSEAGAHFTFELAKTVLMKAGGNSSTSLFTQASTSQNHHGPHRALHMCAFQLGLYALGLHNCVSPNWLSRTYSSHVSWITGQAMEIGAPALTFMMDTWEGHLTPPEAVSIADRASRGCDPNMVAAAAQLALSCLPHAHALNPNEIQRAILQCKEQSDLMLEHSCLTVESAAKGGGVYPEVLFQVAKYWYELYMRHSPGNGEVYMETEPCPPQGVMEEPMAMAGGDVMVVGEPPPPPPHAHQPPPPYHSPPLATIAPYTLAPFGFTVQPLPAHFQLARHPHLAHQVYHLSPPTFQYPPHAANSQPAYASITQPPMQYYGVRSHGAGPHHVFPIAATMQPGTIAQAQLVLTQAPTTQCVTQAVPSPHQLSLPRPQPQQQVLRPGQQYSQTQFRYLLAAYRVGMLALDTLSRRVHDDRPQAKYARNPPYGEDVKWLLRVSKKLGSQYLHQLCMCAVNSIVSPFVLHDMALEAAHYLSPENHYCNNPGLVMQHLRTSLTPLVHKCQQMYIQCMHQKLYHLTTGDYEDFVNILCSARAAFQITPEGNAQFKEWLQSIRRSKSCKKDLWTQINAALQVNSK